MFWQEVSETIAQVVHRAFQLMEDWNFANVPPVVAYSNCSVAHNLTSNSTLSQVDTTTSSSANIHEGQNEQRTHPGMSPISWQRPQSRQVKCNVDTSFFGTAK